MLTKRQVEEQMVLTLRQRVELANLIRMAAETETEKEEKE